MTYRDENGSTGLLVDGEFRPYQSAEEAGQMQTSPSLAQELQEKTARIAELEAQLEKVVPLPDDALARLEAVQGISPAIAKKALDALKAE